MTTHKFKAQLESQVKKLLPANTLPRKVASQLRRRMKGPSIDYGAYEAAYPLSEGTIPSESPMTGRDKLNVAFWIALILLSFAFGFYFMSQTSIHCTEFGCY